MFDGDLVASALQRPADAEAVIAERAGADGGKQGLRADLNGFRAVDEAVTRDPVMHEDEVGQELSRGGSHQNAGDGTAPRNDAMEDGGA